MPCSVSGRSASSSACWLIYAVVVGQKSLANGEFGRYGPGIAGPRSRPTGASSECPIRPGGLLFVTFLLRGKRWMPVSINRKLGPNDRCSPGGAVISATLCAVVEGDAIVGWTANSGFLVREVGVDGTLAQLDFRPTALALKAQDLDTEAAEAGVVGISSLIAQRRIDEQKTGNLPAGLREAAFERATVQILDKLHGHPAGGVLLLER